MAHFEKGILGGFSGKVGTVVGVNWRGINVMRSLPTKSKKAPSEAQIAQRTKFAMSARFMAPLKPITDKYYGQNSGAKSRTNLAMSHQILETIVENDKHEFEFDYSRIVISKGELPAITMNDVGFDNDQFNFTWTSNADQALADFNDKVIFVIYSKKTNSFMIVANEAIKRGDEEVNLAAPHAFVKDDNEIWIFTANVSDTSNSTSVYLGTF